MKIIGASFLECIDPPMATHFVVSIPFKTIMKRNCSTYLLTNETKEIFKFNKCLLKLDNDYSNNINVTCEKLS